MTELTAKYRMVFGNAMGQEVLADILTLTQFGCTLDPRNPEAAAVHNIGIKILMRIGALGPDTKMGVVQALLAIPPTTKEGAKS